MIHNIKCEFVCAFARCSKTPEDNYPASTAMKQPKQAAAAAAATQHCTMYVRTAVLYRVMEGTQKRKKPTKLSANKVVEIISFACEMQIDRDRMSVK